MLGQTYGSSGMSIDQAHADLQNWQRWAHHLAKPSLEIPEPPAFQYWRPHGDSREPGWGDPVPGDRIEDSIDNHAAEATDYLLLRLHVREFTCLHRHYYQQRTQPELELQAALRAYNDLAAVVRQRLDKQKENADYPPRGLFAPAIP